MTDMAQICIPRSIEDGARFGVKWGIRVAWIYAGVLTILLFALLSIGLAPLKDVALQVFQFLLILWTVAFLLGGLGGLVSGLLFAWMLPKVSPRLKRKAWVVGAGVGVAVCCVAAGLLGWLTDRDGEGVVSTVYLVVVFVPSIFYAASAPLLVRCWYRKYLNRS